ncbi:MAG TPA: ABC transporter permease subunit [Pseudonocardiaceae bacterium]|jgi:ABC-2 type transport system permease protein|nr:ABC transporter permease subunit [Pseudonocardiaceae bacterium]
MTAATISAPPAYSARLPITRAPLWRLLRSEVGWVFRRPRTWISLILLAAVPIVMAIGVLVTNGPRDGRGGSLYADLAGNGLELPVIALVITLALLLPLVGAMWAADALAGEASHGTLRGLLIAPVSRVRLLGVKAFGVGTAILAASALIAVVGMITGIVVVGSNGMVTLSGTTLSTWDAIGRVLLAVGWVTFQVWAVAAVALAISACTEHPVIVMGATLAGAIVMGVLSAIPTLTWLQPYLLINSWGGLTDVLRDPMPTAGLIHGMAEAGCYLVIGLSLALARTVTKDG